MSNQTNKDKVSFNRGFISLLLNLFTIALWVRLNVEWEMKMLAGFQRRIPRPCKIQLGLPPTCETFKLLNQVGNLLDRPKIFFFFFRLVSARLPLQPVAGRQTKYPKLSGQVFKIFFSQEYFSNFYTEELTVKIPG